MHAALSSFALLKPDLQQLGDIRLLLLEASRLELSCAMQRQEPPEGFGAARAAQRQGLGLGLLGRASKEWERSRSAACRVASKEAPLWVKQAVEGETFNKSFQLGRAQVELLLQLVQLMGEEDRAVGREEEVEAQQLGIIEQVKVAAQLGVDTYQRWSEGLGIDPASDANEHVSRLREVLGTLPELERKVRSRDHDLEMLQVLAAAAGSGSHGLSLQGALSYMQSHLYRCPNGHVYIIGDCGRAMQRSRCAECGAVIGGGSHTLEATNSAAADVVQRMQRAAGA